MPDIKVYVRTEDYEKWLSIPKKSEWLHEKLQETPSNITTVPASVGKSVTQASDIFVPRPPDPETGYPCCQLKKPCKHWEYDGMNSRWVNSLTGAIKEAVG